MIVGSSVNSTCNDYTSALGAGQKVLSYSFYSPRIEGAKVNNKGLKETKKRFLSLFEPLAQSARRLYPGWRIRIYHNVTEEDAEAFTTLCNLHCQYEFVDLCDTRHLPGQGDLNTKVPIGRVWRFQVLGDPSVAMFACRDSDSYLSEREAAAVEEWKDSGKQWHIMRDLPTQRATILAGMWGGHNYADMSSATQLRSALLDKIPPTLWRGLDQKLLHTKLWPVIKENALIHDSYHCENKAKYGEMVPFPTRRQGFTYVGCGPTREYVSKCVSKYKCPLACRPNEHKDWEYC